MRFATIFGLCLPLVLTGCTLAPTATPTTASLSGTSGNGVAIHGKAFGGQQPVAGAHVYLYAAGTSGYGAAASSLLTSGSNTTVDGSSHYYVTTDSGGNFSITGDYTCITGTGVYLYAVGGNSGSGSNSAVGLLATLGACPGAGNFASATPFVFMDEVSTIAAAYSMAGFATDATHVSSSGTTLAATGIKNAFANAANLASISTGQALATTPNGSGTVPQTEINTLANILASCVNSASSSSTACSTLFINARSAGSSGTTATDTATAAIYMAHNPAANIAALYALGTPTPPFAPALGSAPNDFTIGINFTGGGMYAPVEIAVDGSGKVWVSNNSGTSVSELNSSGGVVSGSPFGGGGLDEPYGIAIDGSGNVWVANDYYSYSVTKLNSSGGVVSGSPFTGGGLNAPAGIAIDGSGNVWTANYVSSGSVTKLNSSGGAVSGSPFTGGGLNYPQAIAIDGSGNAWIANGNSSVSEFNGSGAAVSGSSGFTGGGLNAPTGIAIDGSGNAWTANYNTNSVTEFIGAATPVVTPIAANLITPYSAPASKP
jgi:hypothetical protein